MASTISVQSNPFHQEFQLTSPTKFDGDTTATTHCGTSNLSAPSQFLNNFVHNSIASTESHAAVSEKVEISEKKSAVMDSGVKPKIKIKFSIAGEQTQGAAATDEESGKIESVEKRSRVLEGEHRSKDERKADKKIEDETLVVVNGNVEEKKKKKRPLFSISLTKDEIEADLRAMGVPTAKRSRWMKKRSKSVQKILDHLFPGVSLKSKNPNDYRVN